MNNKKFLLFLTGSALFFLLYLSILIFPALSRITFLKEEIPQARQKVGEMRALSVEYLSIKNKRKKDLVLQNESIFSVVERIAQSRGLSEKISSMKPVSTSEKDENYKKVGVDVKMRGVLLQDMVNYLYILENPPYNLAIKEIQIRPADDRRSLEIDFTVSRLEKIE